MKRYILTYEQYFLKKFRITYEFKIWMCSHSKLGFLNDIT